MYDAKKQQSKSMSSMIKCDTIMDRGFYSCSSYNLAYTKTHHIPRETILNNSYK